MRFSPINEVVVRRDYDESPMRHTTTFAEWHAGRTVYVQHDPHSYKSFWEIVRIIEAEQREEETRLLAEMRAEHRRWPLVKPVPVRIIDRDDAGSIQARIYCPGRPRMSATYSITYNSAPRDEYRAAFLAQLENRFAAATRDPFGFFEDVL